MINAQLGENNLDIIVIIVRQLFPFTDTMMTLISDFPRPREAICIWIQTEGQQESKFGAKGISEKCAKGEMRMTYYPPSPMLKNNCKFFRFLVDKT